MTVTINITGLGPISEAVNSLARALGASGITAAFNGTATPETASAPQAEAQVPQPGDQGAEDAAPSQGAAAAESGQGGAAFTLEEVRAKLAGLQKAGKRAEVKALLSSFGASKLSEVPAASYADLMAKAGGI